MFNLADFQEKLKKLAVPGQEDNLKKYFAELTKPEKSHEDYKKYKAACKKLLYKLAENNDERNDELVKILLLNGCYVSYDKMTIPVVACLKRVVSLIRHDERTAHQNPTFTYPAKMGLHLSQAKVFPKSKSHPKGEEIKDGLNLMFSYINNAVIDETLEQKIAQAKESPKNAIALYYSLLLDFEKRVNRNPKVNVKSLDEFLFEFEALLNKSKNAAHVSAVVSEAQSADSVRQIEPEYFTVDSANTFIKYHQAMQRAYFAAILSGANLLQYKQQHPRVSKESTSKLVTTPIIKSINKPQSNGLTASRSSERDTIRETIRQRTAPTSLALAKKESERANSAVREATQKANVATERYSLAVKLKLDDEEQARAKSEMDSTAKELAELTIQAKLATESYKNLEEQQRSDEATPKRSQTVSDAYWDRLSQAKPASRTKRTSTEKKEKVADPIKELQPTQLFTLPLEASSSFLEADIDQGLRALFIRKKRQKRLERTVTHPLQASESFATDEDGVDTVDDHDAPITDEIMLAYYQHAWQVQRQILMSERLRVTPEQLQLLQVLHAAGDREATAYLIMYHQNEMNYKAGETYESVAKLGCVYSMFKYAEKKFPSCTDRNVAAILSYYTPIVALIAHEKEMQRGDAYSNLVLIETIDGTEVKDSITTILEKINATDVSFPSHNWMAIIADCLRAGFYLPENILDNLKIKDMMPASQDAFNLLKKAHLQLAELSADNIRRSRKNEIYQQMVDDIKTIKALLRDQIGADHNIYHMCRGILYHYGKAIPANTVVLSRNWLALGAATYLDPHDLIRDAAVLGHRQAINENTEYRRTEHPNGERRLLWSGTSDSPQQFAATLDHLKNIKGEHYQNIRLLAKCCEEGLDSGEVQLGDEFIPSLFRYLENAMPNVADHKKPGYKAAFTRLKRGMDNDGMPYPKTEDDVAHIGISFSMDESSVHRQIVTIDPKSALRALETQVIDTESDEADRKRDTSGSTQSSSPSGSSKKSKHRKDRHSSKEYGNGLVTSTAPVTPAKPVLEQLQVPATAPAVMRTAASIDLGGFGRSRLLESIRNASSEVPLRKSRLG